MSKRPDHAARELEAMRITLEALKDLPSDSVRRVLDWLHGHLDGSPAGEVSATRTRTPREAPHGEIAVGGNVRPLGDVFAEATPETGPDRVLVVAYWMQEVCGAEGFQTLDVTRNLAQLGHPVANTAATLNLLQKGTPRLVQQTKKAGASRQARKLYRLTEAGKSRVRALIEREAG